MRNPTNPADGRTWTSAGAPAWLALLLALGSACAETPPDPAANLRLPLGLTRIERPDPRRADIYVADAEAESVRVLQVFGGGRNFLRGPAAFSATGISAPGYPTQVAAAARGSGARVFSLAPGQAVLHALVTEEADFASSTVLSTSRPAQVRVGTIVLTGDRQRFIDADPLQRAANGSYSPPVVALQDAFGPVVDGFTTVALAVVDEARPVFDGEILPFEGVVDTRPLLALSGSGPDGGGRLIAFDVRTITPGAITKNIETTRQRAEDNAQTGLPTEAEFRNELERLLPSDRFVASCPFVVDTSTSPRRVIADPGAIGIDVQAGLAVADVSTALAHLESLFDGSVLSVDTATRSVARQHRVTDLLAGPPAIEPVGEVDVGGAAFRAVAFGDQGAVVLRADRPALVALDCRSGTCERVTTRFPALRSFEDEEVTAALEEVPEGVLLTRAPPAVTGAFGSVDFDGEPLVLRVRREASYRAFPVDERDAEGGILSLVHLDAEATFVVGTIDDLRVATLEGLFGASNDEDNPLVVPEPRVDQVFERRVIVQRGESDLLYPEQGIQLASSATATEEWDVDVLAPRTVIGGPGCLRRDDVSRQLGFVFDDDRVDTVEDTFMGCFPDDSGYQDEFVPRQVRNRFSLDPLIPPEDDCAIDADPVTVDTTYRVTYRGALLRAGSDVAVTAVDDATVQLEFPRDLDAFGLREGDRVDLHLSCLYPDPDTFAELQDDRLERSYLGARVVRAPGLRTLIVSTDGATSDSFFAPTGTPPEGEPRSAEAIPLTSCQLPPPAAETSRRVELTAFDIELYPPEDQEVAVLTRETEGGFMLNTFARCPITSDPGGGQQVRFDDSCQADLPIRFTWSAPTGFRCLDTSGTRVTSTIRREVEQSFREFELIEADVELLFSPDDLGRPCTSSAQCGPGRRCAGQSGSCPGQCEPWCTTNNCYALWTQRACDSLEVRVNGARPIELELSGSTDGTPGATIPGESLYVPEDRLFLHSFPGARNLRGVELDPSVGSVTGTFID